jgi:DNA-directed RNA polymerase specialized sigma24 family protein
MSGNTQSLNAFDTFLAKNYSKVRSQAQQIYWGDQQFEDTLQNSILKTRERITKSGFTNTSDYNFSGYLFLANSNQLKLDKKKENRRKFIDADNPDFKDEIEQTVFDNDHSSQPYRDDLETVVRSLFKYLDRYYSQQHATLYKAYYLSNKNSYKKIAEHSGLAEATVKNILSLMKKDVRENLIPYTIFESTEEVWRPVKFYEGRYWISNKGRVKNKRDKILKEARPCIYRLSRDKKRTYKSLEQLQAVFKPQDCRTFNRVIIINKRTIKMSAEEIKKIIGTGYNASMCSQYRKVYEHIYNRKPSNCSCACGSIYSAIKGYK